VKKVLRPLLAGAGLAGGLAAANRALQNAPLPTNALGGTRRRWTWRGHEIFANEYGAPAGAELPILLVHGIAPGGSSFEYRHLAPLLARGRHVVAFDFLGCGLSDMPNVAYSAELFVDQIVDAIAEFFEGPVAIAGSSLGAAYGIRAALRAQDRVERIVAICPADLSGTLAGDPGLARRSAAGIMRAPLAGETVFNGLASKASLRWQLAHRAYASAASATQDVVDHYYALAHRPGARFVSASFVGGALDADVARDLPFLDVPLLVLWGDDAKARPPEDGGEFVRLARDARMQTFANARLLPHEEAADAVAASIDTFLARGDGVATNRKADASPMAMIRVPDIFKSYDVRGIYPAELSDELAYGIGRAFVAETKAASVVVGRDMRPSGETLFRAFARGATEAGADVTDVGLVSTDALYFAVGKFDYGAGVMITASHNPADYNGLKMTRAKAAAISLDTGLGAIRDRIARGDLGTIAATPGTISQRNVLEDFAAHCLRFVEPKNIKPFKIAIDAGNGMAGLTVPHVFRHLGCEVVPLFFDLDGTFPNHPASPIEPENMIDLQRAVVEGECNLGAAFDGDADRMFIVDEKGGLVGGDMVTALVAINTLRRYPGAKILYNLICSRSVPEQILKHGGIPVRSQVGHSLIKQTMRDEDIVFGGEHSGHFYFRDNWFADSGMIALLQCLEVFSGASGTVSETIAPIDTRFRSGEINSRVHDIPKKLGELQAHYADASIDHLDGVTIQYPDWWMNVRASNTEPLLRLNVEGDTKEVMERHRDEALALIRS